MTSPLPTPASEPTPVPEPIPVPAPAAAPTAKPASYLRFTIDQRVEHVLLLVAFSLLGLTGLVQKFSQAPISEWLIAIMGGIEMVRIIHRINAILMTAESIYHVAALGYRLFVLRVAPTMAPGLPDVVHVIQDVLCYLGLRKHTARYGRYNYAEKAEYWAMIWGTLVMAATGFMLWNPIAVTRLLPGEFIPAAKAAHGGEAILAVLAILLWHFYHVHLKMFNKSMFVGKLTREEMQHEHPAELAHLESTHHHTPPVSENPAARRRRQLIFWPVAVVLVGGLLFGLYWLSTFEVSAIATIPQGETAKIYVPFTPTPSPVPTVTPTPAPVNASATWDTGIGQLFADRCGTCHGAGKSGGLSVQSYAEVLQGGAKGPGVVIANPDASVVVQVQTAGGHPGQFSAEELAQIVTWIKVGAPEK
jgi:cytochrome b subunit of formate dehydrogenase/mono/diheme cytochrome c family protein